MGQLKGHEVDAWLASRTVPPPIVLIYGPDRGLVGERAKILAEASGIALDDPFSVVRLDAAELDRQPGRLIDEANTLPMFAGRRLIWVRNALGQKALADTVKVLCSDPPVRTQVLIEAGDLKKGIGLRAAVETSPAALALPCYADDERAIDSLIDSSLGTAGLSIDPETRSVLKRGLGGNRMATHGELEKLILASIGRKKIDLIDVQALAGDASGAAADEIVDMVLAGNMASFDRLYDGQVRGASQIFTVLSAIQRQFHALLALRLAMQRDRKNAATVVSTARPPVFFAHRKSVEAALDRWNALEFAVILDDLQVTVLETRRRPDLGVAIAYKALMAIVLARRMNPAKT